MVGRAGTKACTVHTVNKRKPLTPSDLRCNFLNKKIKKSQNYMYV